MVFVAGGKRRRVKFYREPYVPKVALDGNINDTAALEKWVASRMK